MRRIVLPAVVSLTVTSLLAAVAAAQTPVPAGPPPMDLRAMDLPPSLSDAVPKPLDGMGGLRDYMQSCWFPQVDTPAVPAGVRINLRRDGTLDGDPVITFLPGESNRTADRLRALIRRCGPYRITNLPYDHWKSLQWLFRVEYVTGPTSSPAPQPLKDLDALRARLRMCWYAPMGTGAAPVRVRVGLRPDGTLNGAPVILSEGISKPTADSLRAAIRLCEPYRVTDVPYDRWRSLTLDFDPRANQGVKVPNIPLDPGGPNPPTFLFSTLKLPAPAALPADLPLPPLTDLPSLRHRLLSCWRLPKSPPPPPVTVTIKLLPDGALDGDPEIQAGANDPAFERTALSLREAIRRCAPYRFTEIPYETWSTVRISFNPQPGAR